MHTSTCNSIYNKEDESDDECNFFYSIVFLNLKYLILADYFFGIEIYESHSNSKIAQEAGVYF